VRAPRRRLVLVAPVVAIAVVAGAIVVARSTAPSPVPASSDAVAAAGGSPAAAVAAAGPATTAPGAAAATTTARPAQPGSEVMPDRPRVTEPQRTDSLVVVAPAVADADGMGRALGREVTSVTPMAGDQVRVGLAAPVSLTEADALLTRLRSTGVASGGEPDRRVRATVAPDDPYYGQQWHLSNLWSGAPAAGIGVEAAWAITYGSSSMVTAVLDTGILAHPDLTGRVLSGYDMISDSFTARDGGGRDADPSDPGDWTTGSEGCGTASSSSWHGLHVTGTIVANTGNGVGVAGIDRAGKVLPVRVLGRCGGYLSDIADAIRWAAGLAVPGVPANPTPAKVLNLSLGGPGACPTYLQSAITAATQAGALVVVAAGNEGVDLGTTAEAPAGCRNVLTVTATSRLGDRASYANTGTVVGIAAPGGDSVTGSVNERILSTWNTGTTSPVLGSGFAYAWAAGTSMATPHASAVAALVRAVAPGLSPPQVVAMLQRASRAFPTSTRSASLTCTVTTCGAGLLDAGRAVAFAAQAAAAPAGADATVQVLRGSGSDTTYQLMTQLGQIYNRSSGCALSSTASYCDPFASTPGD